MRELANRTSREDLVKEIENEDFQRKTVSFYKYVKIANPDEMRDFLYINLKELNCKGRIYIANEGINAQMNIPIGNWEKFDELTQSTPEFKGVPYKVAVEEKGQSSFIKLIVKVKEKIVADGLDGSSFDPADTGDYVVAEEVNDAISRGVTVVDMRNMYEAEIGHFDGAQIMDVDTFREQLEKVEDEFKDKKDEEVILYCTGGIRCEKASAWMKHQGFQNVKHVKGGVIDYAHQVKEKGLENKFKGTNFVFDERLGERIGDEVISNCHVCHKEKTDEYDHCRNEMCHILFLSCEGCKDKLEGYCSVKCVLCDKLPMKINRLFVAPKKTAKGKQFRKNYYRSKMKG
jgi:UPF0176 protein